MLVETVILVNNGTILKFHLPWTVRTVIVRSGHFLDLPILWVAAHVVGQLCLVHKIATTMVAQVDLEESIKNHPSKIFYLVGVVGVHVDRKLLSLFSLETTVGNAAFVFYGFSVVCVNRFHVDWESLLGDKVNIAGSTSVDSFLRWHVGFPCVGLPEDEGNYLTCRMSCFQI